jgi:type IV secretion/conjugal transfer VirB4 family ATPase
MYNLREYRSEPDRLIDYLPWAALIAPGVILNKDGSFQTTFKFRGPDLDSSTPSELLSATARINNALKRLDSGWALFIEAQRSPSTGYPNSRFPDPVSAAIDAERAGAFAQLDGQHYESKYFLTFVYLPPDERRNKIVPLFVENAESRGLSYEEYLEHFRNHVHQVYDLLKGVLSVLEPLSDEETLTYLHSTISTRRHPIRVPDTPMYLDAVLADQHLTCGFEPKLDDAHLRLVTIKSFPGSSMPCLLDNLNRLPLEYRWMIRFIPLDKHQAIREIWRYKRKWFAKRKGVLTLLREAIFKEESVMVDSDALRKAEDAGEALEELADDLVSYGYYTSTVAVWDEDPARVQEKSKAVEAVFNTLGFVVINETVNAVEAWLSTVPGHCRANVRRPLLSSLNLANLMPLSAVWAGQERNTHLDGPPLFYAISTGNTPFRVVHHVGDVGHAMVLGPTGAGKSVLLAFLALQFLRYPKAQVYVFDKGRSMLAATAGVQGDFYDVGARDLSFHPLGSIDDESERAWAHEWVLALLAQEGIEVTPSVKTKIWTALVALASSPEEQRTLTGLAAMLQDAELRNALNDYTLRGPHGHMLDAASDSLRYGRWQCFEMEELMHTPRVVPPVLSYLFHRLEARLDGSPTLIVLDEAWVYLDHPVFREKVREWLKVLRKKNASVVFATQSLADVMQSSIMEVIVESCPTRIFLPNPEAMEEIVAPLYRRFGFNDRQRQLISQAQPKRQYYYQSPLGNRLFELGLSPLALAFCGSSNLDDLAAIKGILAGAGKDKFLSEFLEYKQVALCGTQI